MAMPRLSPEEYDKALVERIAGRLAGKTYICDIFDCTKERELGCLYCHWHDKMVLYIQVDETYVSSSDCRKFERTAPA